MSDFDARDHYWVGSKAAFSSARFATVPLDDAAFVAWREGGGFPAAWPADAAGVQTEVSLNGLLREYGLSTAGVVRSATSYDLVSVLSDEEVVALGRAKPKDQHLFGKRSDAFPEDNPKVARFATVLNTSPKAWFDRVFAPAAQG